MEIEIISFVVDGNVKLTTPPKTSWLAKINGVRNLQNHNVKTQFSTRENLTLFSQYESAKLIVGLGFKFAEFTHAGMVISFL